MGKGEAVVVVIVVIVVVVAVVAAAAAAAAAAGKKYTTRRNATIRLSKRATRVRRSDDDTELSRIENSRARSCPP